MIGMREYNKLEQFQNKEYIRLETVKRNGQARSNACAMTLMFGRAQSLISFT